MDEKQKNKTDRGVQKVLGLRRDIGLLDAVSIGIGAVVGAGIFVVTGVAAGVAGPAFLIGLIVAGFAATCNGLSSAQLAAVYPQSGGTYEYGYRVLSPLAGFSAGWMFLTSKLSAGGVVAIGFGSYLSRIFPVVDPKLGAVLAAVILSIANYFGIRKTGWLNRIIVSITLISLLYFVFTGIPTVDLDNLTPFAPAGLRGIAESSALLFFAFTGYARIATLGEEVRDPKTTIPRAVMITLLLSIFLYAAIAFVAVGTVGAEALSASSWPLGVAAERFSGSGAVFMIGVGATTAMLGVLLSQILGISRMLFAMSRRKDLLKLFSVVHPKHDVPHAGIFFSAAVIILLSLFGTIKFIISAAAFTILLYYSITNLAALRMRKEDKRFPDWIAASGLIACVAMAVSLAPESILAGLVILVIGLLMRWVVRRFHKT